MPALPAVCLLKKARRFALILCGLTLSFCAPKVFAGVWEGVSINNKDDWFNIRLDLTEDGSLVRGDKRLSRIGSTQHVEYDVKGTIGKGRLDLSDEVAAATMGPHWCPQVSYHLVAYDDGWFRGDASDPKCEPNRIALHQSAEKTAETKFCNDRKEIMLALMKDALRAIP